MQTADILKRVRRIEIETGKLVSEIFAGEYLSIFKGQGIEFAEVRQYIPGDDVRSIDWNVSAKTGETFVKKFNEERERSLIIACDVSASQYFGSTGKFKSDVVAELGALFAFSAIKNNDKVGLLLFSDQIELYIPPKKGRRHVLRIIRELLAFKPKSKGTNISLCLDSLNRMIKRKGILLLISDFFGSGYEKSFKLSAKKFDLIPVVVRDRLEAKLPALPAFIEFEALENGSKAMVYLSSKQAGYITADKQYQHDAALRLFYLAGCQAIQVAADGDVVDPVIKFFKQRAKKLRR